MVESLAQLLLDGRMPMTAALVSGTARTGSPPRRTRVGRATARTRSREEAAREAKCSKNKRLASLNKFKSKSRSVLIATDVASRGLDIPHVDIVVNFDIPTHSKDYIHGVGRTARAGRAGRAVTFVTQVGSFS